MPDGPISKPVFVALVTGRTKKEIRDAFGPPNNIVNFGGSDSWFYYSDRLRVTDPDAGVTLPSIGIDFTSSGVASDVVVG